MTNVSIQPQSYIVIELGNFAVLYILHVSAFVIRHCLFDLSSIHYQCILKVCCPISQAASSLIATLLCLFGSPVFLSYCFTGDGQLEAVCVLQVMEAWDIRDYQALQQLSKMWSWKEFGICWNIIYCTVTGWNNSKRTMPFRSHGNCSLYLCMTSFWPGDTISHLREFLLRGCRWLKALVVFACCKFVFQSAVGLKADPVFGRPWETLISVWFQVFKVSQGE